MGRQRGGMGIGSRGGAEPRRGTVSRRGAEAQGRGDVVSVAAVVVNPASVPSHPRGFARTSLRVRRPRAKSRGRERQAGWGCDFRSVIWQIAFARGDGEARRGTVSRRGAEAQGRGDVVPVAAVVVKPTAVPSHPRGFARTSLRGEETSREVARGNGVRSVHLTNRRRAQKRCEPTG